MDIQISVVEEKDDDSTVASLYRWLAQDEELGRSVRFSRVGAAGRLGEMSSGLELINVIVSNAIALSSLIVALASWRESRATPSIISIQRNGVTIAIDDSSPECVQRAIAELSAIMSDSEGDGRQS